MAIDIQVPDIVPFLVELDQNDHTLYLDAVGSSVHISAVVWEGINTLQSVTVFIDGVDAGTDAPALDPDTGLPAPPVFTVATRDYFTAGTTSTVYLTVTQPDGTDGPTSQRTQNLTFPVRADPLSGALTIDITEGAAGYSQTYPDLMPANVAVLRGPAGMELEARSGGRVRFQDVGGATTCIFSFDGKGVCPLVLIRIDALSPSGMHAGDPDRLIVTRRGETVELIGKPVVFGEYVPATDDAALAFDSVSCNTLGIADGQTMCIVSIIMKDPAADDTLYIKLDEGLTLADHTYNKGYAADGGVNLPSIPISRGMAEFGVMASRPGTYTIGAFPRMQPTAYWSNQIEFRSLS